MSKKATDKTASQSGRIGSQTAVLATKKQLQTNDSIIRIIESTIECIATYGYENASMKIISDNAGVSKSLLHYHFRSKEDLLFKAVDFCTKQIAEEVSNLIEDENRPIKKLMLAADALFEKLVAHPERTAFLTEMYATAIYNKKLRKRMEEYNSNSVQLIKYILDTTIGDKAKDASPSTEKLALIIQTSIQGLILDSIYIKDKKELLKRYGVLKDFILPNIVSLIDNSAVN